MSLKTFPRGGIHVPDRKLTAQSPIQALPKPAKVVIPLGQHTGKPAKPKVAKGDLVAEGQMIGERDGVISAAVHASIAGKVKDIVEHPTAAFSRVPAVVIESCAEAEALPPVPPLVAKPWEELTAEEMVQAVADAGIVGLGGAAFPTAVKLSPPKGKTITDLIVNAVECEPYLTADHRLMLEQSEEILLGVEVLRRILKPQRVFIGIENNKPDAVALLREKAKGRGVEVVALKEKYPQGGEKQLIAALTGRKVPSGGLPMDVGCVVQNVGTVVAVKRAVCDGKPLTERVVTITGRPVRRPGNYRVRIGTLLSDLLEAIGGLEGEPGKVVFGGPMTGPAVARLDLPIVKGTSGVLFLTKEEAERADWSAFLPCIRCGACVMVCPMALNPSLLSQSAEASRWQEMKGQWVMDCIECGSCAYVCPSRRPIVQWIKAAKSHLRKVV